MLRDSHVSLVNMACERRWVRMYVECSEYLEPQPHTTTTCTCTSTDASGSGREYKYISSEKHRFMLFCWSLVPRLRCHLALHPRRSVLSLSLSVTTVDGIRLGMRTRPESVAEPGLRPHMLVAKGVTSFLMLVSCHCNASLWTSWPA